MCSLAYHIEIHSGKGGRPLKASVTEIDRDNLI